jgi:uncharacterized hydrophobic protein (TIGR00271 family)
MSTMSPPEKPSQDLDSVRLTITDGAKLDWAYLLMNVLATVIASYGLLSNSPAVVIGAMIVAMLLGPITAVALALVDSNRPLLRSGLLTLLAGAGGVLVTAYVIGLIHRDIPITDEIMSRTAPNLLDLMIALAGGAAGAYATVSPRLSVAFVGVAIATALVPPLTSAGILFARGEVSLAGGALLLAFTNMVGIQFASSVVLWCSGFHRLTDTTGLGLLILARRNAVSIIMLSALVFTLSVNLDKVVAEQLYKASVRSNLQQSIDKFAGDYLAGVRFEQDTEKIIVRALVRGPSAPLPEQVADMESRLPAAPTGAKSELRVRFVEARVISPNGALFKDLSLPARIGD